jgi:hypothetical protein
MATLSVNRRYSFSVYANSVLGSTYRNARLVSIMDYKSALAFANIPLLHHQVFPYLPANTPEAASKYTYYLFVVNDRNVILADVWIVNDSVVESSGVDYVLKLQNPTSEQLSQIRDQLRLLGVVFTIS